MAAGRALLLLSKPTAARANPGRDRRMCSSSHRLHLHYATARWRYGGSGADNLQENPEEEEEAEGKGEVFIQGGIGNQSGYSYSDSDSAPTLPHEPGLPGAARARLATWTSPSHSSGNEHGKAAALEGAAA